MTMEPIIDTHQHLWDLNRFRLPWIQPGHPLARNHVTDDYLRETDGCGVVGTVYMEVDVAPEHQPEEAEYVVELCRRPDNPMRGAIISGRPAEEGFEPYIRRFAGPAYGGFVKGARQVLHGSMPAGFCLQPSFIRSVRLLGELGLSFDVCIRPEDIGEAAKLADACPGTQFVLDHCGNADVQSEDLSQWRRDIDSLARRPNVACKISGIIVTAKPGEWDAEDLAPIVLHCAGAFGPDRIVFGGDWPVCTLTAPLREWISALRQIISSWPEDRRRKLLHDNALRVYRLEV
jgi:L-fuconolactonase